MDGIADTPSPEDPGIVTPLRVLLIVAVPLVALAGVPLYVFADRTDEWFAWTISPSLTAAFLGAGYWATLLPLSFATWYGRWRPVTIVVVTTLGFAYPMLAATLIHLDRFHFGDAFPSSARFAAWLWLVVYVAVPPALTWFAILQRRRLAGTARDRESASKATPSATRPVEAIPGWLRAMVGMVGAIAAIVGLALWLRSAATGGWPWELTPLTARAIGSLLLGFGAGSIAAVFYRDPERYRLLFPAYATFGALQLLALVRFSDAVRDSGASGWWYVAACTTALVTGIAGILVAGRAPAGSGARSSVAS